MDRESEVLTVWPSGLRRCVKAAVRKGVGSNPTAVTFFAKSVRRLSAADARFAYYDASRSNIKYPSIAQLVEHLTVDQMVPGSIPGRRTFTC